MTMSDLMWHKGRTMRVLHQNELTREEKDLLRQDDGVVQHGKLFLKEIEEEPGELTSAPIGDFEEEQELDSDPTTLVKEEQEDGGDKPTMSELRSMKVAELHELADEEDVDLTGLKLKDDILGRLAAHFGLDPAES